MDQRSGWNSTGLQIHGRPVTSRSAIGTHNNVRPWACSSYSLSRGSTASTPNNAASQLPTSNNPLSVEQFVTVAILVTRNRNTIGGSVYTYRQLPRMADCQHTTHMQSAAWF